MLIHRNFQALENSIVLWLISLWVRRPRHLLFQDNVVSATIFGNLFVQAVTSRPYRIYVGLRHHVAPPDTRVVLSVSCHFVTFVSHDFMLPFSSDFCYVVHGLISISVGSYLTRSRRLSNSIANIVPSQSHLHNRDLEACVGQTKLASSSRLQ